MPFYIEWLIHSYLHEAQCDTLGNKKPCLHVVDGVNILVAGVGIEPTTSRLWALISTTELTCDIIIYSGEIEVLDFLSTYLPEPK